MIEDILRSKYEKFLTGLDIYENKHSLVLSRIIINKDVRGEGIGKKLMTDLINYADRNKQIVVLTPSSDFGGSKDRLIQFYKQFGFKHNKGQYKNFEFQHSMIRYPRGMNESKKLSDNLNIYLRKHENKWNVSESTKSNIKRLFREHVELTITDETPDVLIYNIIYNTREIGSIGLSLCKDMMWAVELVFVELRPEYKEEALLVIKQVIMAIWEIFPKMNYILVMPQPQSRSFWHLMGANRLNDGYLMITKGH